MLDTIKSLIEEKKYSKIKSLLIEMNEFDIAEVLEELPHNEIVKIFNSFELKSIDDVLIKCGNNDVMVVINGEISCDIINLLNSGGNYNGI